MESNRIDINLSSDIKTDRAQQLKITLMSRDINNNQFRISLTSNGEKVQLNDSFTVEVLSVFQKTKAEILTTAEVYGDQALWSFDTSFITGTDVVYNYVYIKKDGVPIVSADANAFYFNVGLSKIDENAGKVAETYDQNYEKVLHEFEVRVTMSAEEIEAVAVNEAQRQANEVTRQADFANAQSDRQATFDVNEASRETSEATRKTAETDRVSSETTRKTNETTRISNEDARKSAEVIRLANELDRVNAESVRSEFYEGFDGELGKKANKQQEEWITPTYLNGWVNTSIWADSLGYFKDEFGIVHLKGWVRNGIATKLFVLPLGYRPYRNCIFPIASQGKFGSVTVDMSGDVYLAVYDSSNVSISGITFKAGV